MDFSRRKLITCEVLLEEMNIKELPVLARSKLSFGGIGERDVYNITAPFLDEGRRVLAGRVEARDCEDSEIMFFTERDGIWSPQEGAPVFRLQDPFFTHVDGELVLGGVQIYPHPGLPGELKWRTLMYKGPSLAKLQLFFTGPEGMKDIRLVQLPGGDIAVFTRPQGQKGGRGKIGFIRVGGLEQLSAQLVQDAPLLEEQFAEGEWGGVNEAMVLANGLVGVLGHIARFDENGNRNYYPMVFALNPDTGEHSEIEIIAVRDDFIPGPAKRKDLTNVVFSGGIVRRTDDTADLYAGTGDAEAQWIRIPDPFLKYEQETNRNTKNK
jgi:hypothetical protein